MGIVAGIEATRGCNFKCPHCFVAAGRPRPGEMGTGEIRGVIADLARLRCDTIAWSGGEALIRRDLDELTAYGASRGVRMSLATNGFLASRERLGRLRSSGLQTIQISLDAATADRAERYRRGPAVAYERSVAAVRESVRLGLDTVVCTLLTPETASEAEEMASFARGLGARSLRYTIWAPTGRAAGGTYDERAWKSPGVARFLALAERHPPGADFEILVDCPTGPLPGWSAFACFAGMDMVYITAVGDVYPCTALMAPRYLVGNLRVTPLRRILDDPAMRLVHDEVAARPPGGACRACGIREACQGGCPGRTFMAFGRVRGGARDGEQPACLHRLHDPSHVGPRKAAAVRRPTVQRAKAAARGRER